MMKVVWIYVFHPPQSVFFHFCASPKCQSPSTGILIWNLLSHSLDTFFCRTIINSIKKSIFIESYYVLSSFLGIIELSALD